MLSWLVSFRYNEPRWDVPSAEALKSPELALGICRLGEYIQLMKTDQNKKSAVFLSLFVNCKKATFQFSSFHPTAGFLGARRKWGRLKLSELLSQHVSAVCCCVIVQLSVEPKLIVVSYAHRPRSQQWALISAGCGRVAQRPPPPNSVAAKWALLGRGTAGWSKKTHGNILASILVWYLQMWVFPDPYTL